MTLAATVPELLAERVRRDGAHPLVTYLHAGSGERMELSATSLANAIAKTAGLLRDDLDAQPGDIIGVHLPLHWQAAVWWGACAATSTVCAPGAGSATVGVTTAADLPAVSDCGEQVVVSLAPFGLPDGAEVPAGVTQAAIAARVHPDVFTPWSLPTAADSLLRCGGEVLTSAQCLERAATLADGWEVHPGGRLLVTETAWSGDGADCVDAWLALLAVPLIRDASVVLLAGAAHPGGGADTYGQDDQVIARVIAGEKVTASVPVR